ncbi:DUF3899 domain-containing protein [Mesobacillus maritimus]|uniref:DUF3899 domain-containing protein n=1 Tax=Mesobacillus maritimus TaxID=1643336 RepID=A0ABS7K5I9_9BACI|nr:DUF3899 domain-containing protein [Mesobacillus maritimus]MBY0097526.1 DUF3899 domain-containing protein [Mesobacillus maritimus]
MFKRNWSLFLINILLSFIFFFISADEYTLLHYINMVFYICFLYVIIFLIQYTMKGGFFDGITFGFRRFHHKLFNKNDYMEEWRDKPLPSEKIQPSVYHMIIFQSISLILVLILLLGLYYFVL